MHLTAVQYSYKICTIKLTSDEGKGASAMKKAYGNRAFIMCMMMRGVKKQEADLVSISARGAFENNLELQAQVLSLIRGTDGNADE